MKKADTVLINSNEDLERESDLLLNKIYTDWESFDFQTLVFILVNDLDIYNKEEIISFWKVLFL